MCCLPGTDFMASLDELQSSVPSSSMSRWWSTWFGDDLRAGNCPIRPAVIDNGTAGFSSQWRVSG